MEKDQIRWLLEQNEQHQDERRGWQDEWRIANEKGKGSAKLFYLTMMARPVIELSILIVLVFIWNKP